MDEAASAHGANPDQMTLRFVPSAFYKVFLTVHPGLGKTNFICTRPLSLEQTFAKKQRLCKISAVPIVIVILIFKSGVIQISISSKKELAGAVVPRVKLAGRAGRLNPMQKSSSVVWLPEVLQKKPDELGASGPGAFSEIISSEPPVAMPHLNTRRPSLTRARRDLGGVI